MLLYIHVPFCQQKCAYCAFYSVPLSTSRSRTIDAESKKSTGLTDRHARASSPVPPCPARPNTQPLTASDLTDSPCSTLSRLPIFPTQPLKSATPPAVHNNHLLESYTKTLVAEITLRAQSAEHSKQPVSSIFFGGGTPSLLSSQQVGTILNALQQRFSFAPNLEITMEANPESASRPDWLHAIRQEGVNRLSLGIQSFDDQDLRLLGRGHTRAQAEKTLNLAHQANFTSISLDLMWGIPRLVQKQHSSFPFTAHWLATLTSAVKLSPHHISAYGLILEEDTPLAQKVHMAEEAGSEAQSQPFQVTTESGEKENTMSERQDKSDESLSQTLATSSSLADPPSKQAQQTPQSPQFLKVQQRFLLLPHEDEERDMYRKGIELLKKHGFEHYEISNYAKPGHQCRHNLGYWQGQNYYGFGPSAVSTLGARRLSNIAHLEHWAKGVEQGKIAGEEEILTPPMLQEEKVMLSLRMTRGLSTEDWRHISPVPLNKLPLVTQLIHDKLATFDAGHLALTPSGMMVSNAIISRLFEAIP